MQMYGVFGSWLLDLKNSIPNFFVLIIKPFKNCNSTGSRSRKQVFVTAKKSSAHPVVSASGAGNSSASPIVSIATPTTTTNTAEEDRDILEEDLNDLNYIPYPKIGAGRGKRGRPPKSH